MCEGSFSTKGKAAGALTLYLSVADVCSYVKQKKITYNEHLFHAGPREGHYAGFLYPISKGEQKIKELQLVIISFSWKKKNFTCKRLTILTTKSCLRVFLHRTINNKRLYVVSESPLIFSYLRLEYFYLNTSVVFHNSFRL